MSVVRIRVEWRNSKYGTCLKIPGTAGLLNDFRVIRLNPKWTAIWGDVAKGDSSVIERHPDVIELLVKAGILEVI